MEIPLLAAAQPHYHNLFNWLTAKRIRATATFPRFRLQKLSMRDETV